jgi:hypothetical protein
MCLSLCFPAPFGFLRVAVADLTPTPELLRSLARLVRGLSCLFWGLPLALVVSMPEVQSAWLGRVGFIPPVATAALICYGTWLLGSFQKQERIWVTAHSRVLMLAMFNLGLSPFVVWWERMPSNNYFAIAALLFNVGQLGFLYCLNLALERLGAMLPDETLRQETRYFTAINRWLIILLFVGAGILLGTMSIPSMTESLARALAVIHDHQRWFALPFVLFPVAVTMALLWKTKEIILESVFSGH